MSQFTPPAGSPAPAVISRSQNASAESPAPAGLNERCRRCGRPLVPNEKALTKKMISRGAESFLCLSCLADHFEVPEQALRQKIKEFREMGCTLFNP